MGRGGKRHGPPYGGPRQQTNRSPQAANPLESMSQPFIRGRDIDLGDLSGEAQAPVLATFTYFGKRFRANPDLNEVMVMDLLEASGDMDSEDPRQLALVKGWVRDHIHPQDFDDLWKLARRNGQGMADMLRLCARVLELVTERPTTPPTDSSDGRGDTRPNSRGGAPPTDIERYRGIARRAVERFEAEGRPDKAVQVMLALQAREAQASVSA